MACSLLTASLGWNGCAQTVRRPAQDSPWWAAEVVQSPVIPADADSAAVETPDASGGTVQIEAPFDSLTIPSAAGSPTVMGLPMAGPKIHGIEPVERSREPQHPMVVELSETERDNLRESYALRTDADRDRVEQVNMYALWCVERKMWAEARTHLEQAIAKDSLAASLHNNLGILYERLGEPDKARTAYERALVLRPGKTAYQSNLRRLDGADVSDADREENRLRRHSEYRRGGEETDDLFEMVPH